MYCSPPSVRELPYLLLAIFFNFQTQNVEYFLKAEFSLLTRDVVSAAKPCANLLEKPKNGSTSGVERLTVDPISPCFSLFELCALIKSLI